MDGNRFAYDAWREMRQAQSVGRNTSVLSGSFASSSHAESGGVASWDGRGLVGLGGKNASVANELCLQSSSDEDGTDSGSEDGVGSGILQKLEASIFEGYVGMQKDCKGGDEEDYLDPEIFKIRDILVASRIGAISCLICLEKVRVTDPVWDCKAECYAVFHLICIQAWARQASTAAAERSANRLSREHFPGAITEAARTAHWHCPKCRTEYTQSQIPREYRCFCGKELEPAHDPWLTPHSCGEICERSLPGNCGHECKLLCHPGPCPPCPQFVRVQCHCGVESEVRRCGRKEFSCGRPCSKRLPCGIHDCEKSCHAGACPPCQKTGLHRCRCTRVLELRACAEAEFQCDQPCGRELSCMKHCCNKICHPGPCGDCELQGRRTCPCGKIEYKGMACDVSAPTCGSTCEKLLHCSLHRCQERCHYGDCDSTCRIVTAKFCRCGNMRKEVPCYQDLQCERKCQRIRDCTRHPCKRRCCDGACPPCAEVCGRKLRCGSHKCPAPCHRGQCAPCPLTIRISCACGATAIEVPCGTEKDQKPPRCSKKCLILPCCCHGTNCKPHHCHYGACPPCQLICDKELPCGHKCKQRCHGPRPSPVPEYTLRPKRKRRGPDNEAENSGLPCPPCPERVVETCLGEHEGGERMMICSQRHEFECGRLCGNPLACGNHFCQKMCHKVTMPRGVSNGSQIDKIRDWGSAETTCSMNGEGRPFIDGEGGKSDLVDTCEQCSTACQKKREPWCPHPCMQTCHPGDCLQCRALIKRPCYCGALVHVFECSWFNSLSESDRKLQLSCGGPCHRKLPTCTHLCPEICHPGPCMAATSCRKKVTVRCACQRIKREWRCVDVQASYSSKPAQKEGPKFSVGVGLLACDQECLMLLEQQKLKMEEEGIHQKNSAASQDLPINKIPKRRRQHGTDTLKNGNSNIKEISWCVLRTILLSALVLLLGLMIYFGYRGLFALSDWMNELDATRPRKRPPGSLII